MKMIFDTQGTGFYKKAVRQMMQQKELTFLGEASGSKAGLGDEIMLLEGIDDLAAAYPYGFDDGPARTYTMPSQDRATTYDFSGAAPVETGMSGARLGAPLGAAGWPRTKDQSYRYSGLGAGWPKTHEQSYRYSGFGATLTAAQRKYNAAFIAMADRLRSVFYARYDAATILASREAAIKAITDIAWSAIGASPVGAPVRVNADTVWYIYIVANEARRFGGPFLTRAREGAYAALMTQEPSLRTGLSPAGSRALVDFVRSVAIKPPPLSGLGAGWPHTNDQSYRYSGLGKADYRYAGLGKPDYRYAGLGATAFQIAEAASLLTDRTACETACALLPAGASIACTAACEAAYQAAMTALSQPSCDQACVDQKAALIRAVPQEHGAPAPSTTTTTTHHTSSPAPSPTSYPAPEESDNTMLYAGVAAVLAVAGYFAYDYYQERHAA